MKKHILLFLSVFFLLHLTPAPAQEFGKMRPARERAANVVKQKNDYVSRVLASYKIRHEINDQGVVVRIDLGGRWLKVNTIEIVPLLQNSNGQSQQVTAHELYFYTDGGILDLVSELVIR